MHADWLLFRWAVAQVAFQRRYLPRRPFCTFNSTLDTLSCKPSKRTHRFSFKGREVIHQQQQLLLQNASAPDAGAAPSTPARTALVASPVQPAVRKLDEPSKGEWRMQVKLASLSCQANVRVTLLDYAVIILQAACLTQGCACHVTPLAICCIGEFHGHVLEESMMHRIT